MKAMTTGLPKPTKNAAKDNKLEDCEEKQQQSLTQQTITFSGYRKPLTQTELDDCVTVTRLKLFFLNYWSITVCIFSFIF